MEWTHKVGNFVDNVVDGFAKSDKTVQTNLLNEKQAHLSWIFYLCVKKNKKLLLILIYSSFIDQACSVKMPGCKPGSLFAVL